jgi:hypothetical protein
MGWGLFHASCLIDDGCPGPRSSIGVVPTGLSTAVFPVGLFVGLAVAATATWWAARIPRVVPPEPDTGAIVRATAAAVLLIATARLVMTIAIPAPSGGRLWWPDAIALGSSTVMIATWNGRVRDRSGGAIVEDAPK